MLYIHDMTYTNVSFHIIYIKVSDGFGPSWAIPLGLVDTCRHSTRSLARSIENLAQSSRSSFGSSLMKLTYTHEGG